MTSSVGTLRVHAPSVDAGTATGLLRRLAIGPLSPRRLVGRAVETLVGIDLALVPHWYCRYPVVAETRGGTERRDAWVMVDGLDGRVLRLPAAPQFDRREPDEVAPAAILPPVLAAERAATTGREALRWDVQVRGRQRVSATVEPATLVELGFVPIWLGYYSTPGGALRATGFHGVERRSVDGMVLDRLLHALDGATE